jgi:hypothetical protein
LTIFNDAIIRRAIKAGVPLLDVVLIWNAEADGANLIDPSMAGRANNAVAMARVVREHKFGAREL